MITTILIILALIVIFVGGVLVGKRNAAKLAAGEALAINAASTAKAVATAVTSDVKAVADEVKKL